MIREYHKWKYTLKTMELTEDFKMNPAKEKLFNMDIIDENYNILHSSVRSMKYISRSNSIEFTELISRRWRLYAKSIYVV